METKTAEQPGLPNVDLNATRPAPARNEPNPSIIVRFPLAVVEELDRLTRHMGNNTPRADLIRLAVKWSWPWLVEYSEGRRSAQGATLTPGPAPKQQPAAEPAAKRKPVAKRPAKPGKPVAKKRAAKPKALTNARKLAKVGKVGSKPKRSVKRSRK